MTHSSLRFVRGGFFFRRSGTNPRDQVSNWIDIIEDIEENPEAAQILSTYEGTEAFPVM